MSDWYLGSSESGDRVQLDGDDLTTHGVIVGMTGSGKTGLGVICLEEALLAGVPVIAIDPKGDMGNLALVFPGGRAEDFAPWVPADADPAEVAERWTAGLTGSGIAGDRLEALASSPVSIYTPGGSAGLPLGMLGSLTPPTGSDPESIRDEARALVSSLLLMAGLDADPVADPEHVLLATLVERAWVAGRTIDLGGLIAEVIDPPMRKLGVFETDRFLPPDDREALALRLNTIVASPTAAAWMHGAPFDVDALTSPVDGRPPATVISIAHLDDASRQFVVATILAKVVTWARRQAGTDRLRLLVYMDEVFGFAPPSAAPPSKEPILTLMKQGRAHGVGMLLATQNPMDLDYKAMSNAGTWLIGRLQTERDRARIVEGMRSAAGTTDADALGELIGGLEQRRFVLHRTRADQPTTFSTRWAMSYLAGPLDAVGLERLTPNRPESDIPSPDADDDSVEVPPAVADGTPTSWAHPSAPWLDRIPTAGAGDRWRAGTAARVALRFDDRHAGVEHHEEWEAVWPVAPPATDPGTGIAVDHDDRDFATEPPRVARYELPDAPIDTAAYWRTLRSSIVAALVAGRQLSISKNVGLGLYGRVGEGAADFAARCRAVAEEGADAELAALKDRYTARVRTARERLRAAESKASSVAVELEADQADELVAGIGDLLGAFAGGRSGSAALRRAARRRSEATRNEQRLTAAEDTVAARLADIDAIEADLAEDVERITAEWDEKATAIEEVAIGLERDDVRVLDLRLVWLPA
jgi:hypothetical protein